MSSLPGSVPLAPLQLLPPLREGFFRSLCPFCLFMSPRVFRLVCIPYTHAAHSPSLSRYLKTLRTGSSFILPSSLSCQRHFSLSSLSSYPSSSSSSLCILFFLLCNPNKHMVSIAFLKLSVLLSVLPLCYSCTGSTGSSWETSPDGRLHVCWQRDNGGDRQGTTPQPPAEEGSAGDIINITLWPWRRITVTHLPPRSLVPTPNAKVSI